MADVITEPSQVPQPAAHVSADAIAGILDGPAAGDAIVSRRTPWLLLLLLALAGGIAAAAPIVLPFLGRRDATDSLANHPSHTVARRDLTISVTESATLASTRTWKSAARSRGARRSSGSSTTAPMSSRATSWPSLTRPRSRKT